MKPWLEDADVRLYHGDILDVLRELPAESIDCCVTSPPYWGLRDYGTGAWEGGDAECDHIQQRRTSAKTTIGRNSGGDHAPMVDAPSMAVGLPYPDTCGKCGATRIDQQLGLEPTPEQYVTRMVEVFREVRRVLAAHGTVWLNLGDSYAGTGAVPGQGWDGHGGDVGSRASWAKGEGIGDKRHHPPSGLKQKDLCGIPWRVAFALQQPYYAGRIKDERERIWLAAVVEAEGCMFIHKRKTGQPNGQGYKRKNDSYGAGLEVSSTDRVIVERCMEITGLGSICEQSPDQNARRKQTIYRWNLRSNVCREVIRELYPHFLAKQHEARLLLGCPSSGEKAERAHRSLKAIHQGEPPDIDFAAPETMFEGGWYLRSDIIWSKKPNPMPESVTDRPTKSHEFVFLLSKNPRYFFDQEAVRESYEPSTLDRNAYARTKHVRQSDGSSGGASYLSTKAGGERVFIGPTKEESWTEPSDTSALFVSDSGTSENNGTTTPRSGSSQTSPTASAGPVLPQTTTSTLHPSLPPEAPRGPDGRRQTRVTAGEFSEQHRDGERWPNGGRNIRSVWEIATQPYPEAHFATFPEELARRCLLAGCPEFVCDVCGRPRTAVQSEHGSSTVSGVRNGVEPASEEVLLANVRESEDRSGASEHEGLRDDEGLQVVATSGASDGEQRGLRDGASPSDGGTSRTNADDLRSGASRQRGSSGQPSGELAPDGETESRPDGEATTETDPVSSLRRSNSPTATCSETCGGSFRPGVALDPFVGSGTVAYVARKLGRHAVGIDLNESYLHLAARRLQQQSLFAEAASGL